MNRTAPRCLVSISLALAWCLLAVRAPAELADYEPWDEEIVEIFKAMPIQEGGRIKPMQAYAETTLLRYNAMRALRFETADGTKHRVEGSAWLLDVFFRPEVAKAIPCFIVNDSDAVIAIGVEEHAKRRSRYSYDELAPAREKLSELAREYGEIEEAERTGKQNQIVDLARNVFQFEFLEHTFDFARDGLDVNLPEISPELAGEGVAISTFLENMGAIREAAADPAKLAAIDEALRTANNQMMLYLNTARSFAIIPPQGDDQEDAWLLPAEIMEDGVGSAADGGGAAAFEIGILRKLEGLAQAEPGSPAFAAALKALSETTIAAAEARGEMKSVPLELALYAGKFPLRTQLALVFGFLFLAASLLFSRRGAGLWLRRAGEVCAIIATLLLLGWLTLRCLIMGRAPVANLYETILFIVAIIMLLALGFHYLTKRPFVLPVALFAGSTGIFISMLYDRMKGEDTMGPLVAVLNSNFWLWTHVTTVTMGYAACLLAAKVSHVFVFEKLFGSRNKELFRDLTPLVYAIICFGLFFSLIGTILGGIWANDSWGRFWGWDPKENGALMIVLGCLAILHARLGGLIKQDGIHFCSIGLAMVTAFSWWYVNVMGVGLHSYGFTSGIKRAVWIYWGIELAVIVAGVVGWLLARSDSKASGSAKQGPAPNAAHSAA